jgi:hypothetical protein
MKFTTICHLTLCAQVVYSSPAPARDASQSVLQKPGSEELYLIQLSPTETRWIKEDEKWELRKVRN